MFMKNNLFLLAVGLFSAVMLKYMFLMNAFKSVTAIAIIWKVSISLNTCSRFPAITALDYLLFLQQTVGQMNLA